MLKNFRIAEGKVEQAPDLSEIRVFINPDDKEKEALIQSYLLDEHTLNSCLDPDELGRVEFEPGHTAVIIKRPKRFSSEDNFLLKVASVGLFLFNDKLVIVISEGDIVFDGRKFIRLRSLHDLFLKLISFYIQHFQDHLKAIQLMSDDLEREIHKALSNKDLYHMFNLEKSLVYYLNAISSNMKVVEKIRNNSAKIGLTQEATEILDDLVVENSQCYEQANTYAQVLSSLMDAWASIINNNLNIRIKMLTILSICIMVPTFIVSLFSMNMPLPIPFHDTIFPFWFVFGLAVISIIVVIATWKIRKW